MCQALYQMLGPQINKFPGPNNLLKETYKGYPSNSVSSRVVATGATTFSPASPLGLQLYFSPCLKFHPQGTVLPR